MAVSKRVAPHACGGAAAAACCKRLELVVLLLAAVLIYSAARAEKYRNPDETELSRFFVFHKAIPEVTAMWRQQMLYASPRRNGTLRVVACGDSTVRNAYEFFVDLFVANRTPADIPDHVVLRQLVWDQLTMVADFRVQLGCGHVLNLYHAWQGKQEEDAMAAGAAVAPRSAEAVYWINLGGLHFLHLLPGRGWHYRQWLGYAENGYTTLTRLLEAPGTAAVLFQTTHAVCEQRFVGSYAALAADPNTTLCEAFLESLPPVAHDSRNRTQDCLDGKMAWRGSWSLYQKELEIIARLQPVARGRLHVIDGFAQTNGQCWASNPADGRHYLAMMPHKVSTVLHVLATA
jgi:hypothetical protein